MFEFAALSNSSDAAEQERFALLSRALADALATMPDKRRAVCELRWREGAVLAPVLALIIFLGVYPKPVLDRMSPSVKALVQRVDERSGTHQPAGAAEGKHP